MNKNSPKDTGAKDQLQHHGQSPEQAQLSTPRSYSGFNVFAGYPVPFAHSPKGSTTSNPSNTTSQHASNGAHPLMSSTPEMKSSQGNIKHTTKKPRTKAESTARRHTRTAAEVEPSTSGRRPNDHEVATKRKASTRGRSDANHSATPAAAVQISSFTGASPRYSSRQSGPDQGLQNFSPRLGMKVAMESDTRVHQQSPYGHPPTMLPGNYPIGYYYTAPQQYPTEPLPSTRSVQGSKHDAVRFATRPDMPTSMQPPPYSGGQPSNPPGTSETEPPPQYSP